MATDPETNEESLETRLATLIPDTMPEDEETRAALQARMMDIFSELNEIAEAVEDMTREMLAAYGLTAEDLEGVELEEDGEG